MPLGFLPLLLQLQYGTTLKAVFDHHGKLGVREP